MPDKVSSLPGGHFLPLEYGAKMLPVLPPSGGEGVDSWGGRKAHQGVMESTSGEKGGHMGGCWDP